MRVLLIIILLLPMFSNQAYAENVYEQAARETGIYQMEDSLPEDARALSGKLSLDGSFDVKGALERLWKNFIQSVVGQIKENVSAATGLIAIAALCALAGSLCNSATIRSYIDLCGCCAAAVALMGGMDGIVSQTVESLNQLSDYSKAALPCLFTAAAACGAVSSASAKYAVVCVALEIMMSVAQKVIVPMVYAYLSVSLAGSLFPNSMLSTMARLTKWLATTIMTALTIAFSAYLGMTGLISGTVDAMAVKTARTVISTSLPVVGGIISDASAVVLSAASVIKNSAGVFGLVAVAALCAGPFALLSVKMLILKAAAAASEMVPNSRLSSLISSVSTAMGLLLGLLGCCGIMLFISIMAGIKVVGA